MPDVHPAFADIQERFTRETLSEPFVRPDAYVVVNEFFSEPADKLVPFAIGVTAIRGGRGEFFAHVSSISTTPLNHATKFLEHYDAQVGEAHGPMSSQLWDSEAGVRIAQVLQGGIRRAVEQDNLRVLSGFALCLSRDPQKTIAGFVISRRSLEVIREGVARGISTIDRRYKQELRNRGQTKDDLTAEASRVILPVSAGRLLPVPSEVRQLLTSSSPALQYFFSHPEAVQERILATERMETTRYN